MTRFTFLLLVLITSFINVMGKTQNAVVADSYTHTPLANASIFDRNGKNIGMCRSNGMLPYIAEYEYPITVRYIGFSEKTVPYASSDTIFLDENISVLQEVIIESRQHRVLHMLAYMREYSTLTTYTDTVFMFRKKMVDFMLPTANKSRFKGWRTPRTLKSKSYYRFSNAEGLDSVSDKCSNHFTWSDWIAIMPTTEIPSKLITIEHGTDTVHGKYSPTEIWSKNNDRITVDIDILSNAKSRKWVPNLSVFFQDDIDFEQFKLRCIYDNVIGGYVTPIDIKNYSYNIESNGRGHNMFMFNRYDQPFYVSTYAEVYIMDSEYISIPEARKWEQKLDIATNIDIYEPNELPELQPEIELLVQRVNSVDNDKIRLSMTPDQRLRGREVEKVSFEKAVLQRLKNMLGISYYRGKKKANKKWELFRQDTQKKNNQKFMNECDSIKK